MVDSGTYFSDFFAYLMALMASSANIFEPLSQTIFLALASVAIAWFGFKMMVTPGPVPIDRLMEFILTMCIGSTMVFFYSAPIPVWGISFYHLIVDQGTAMANMLATGIVKECLDRINLIYFSTEAPTLSWMINIGEVVRWIITVLLLLIAQGAIFLVIGIGYIATAFGVVLGPFMVPFFIFPKMEWMFWNWLRAFMQYGIGYPVGAYVSLTIFCNLIVKFVDNHPPPYDGVGITKLFVPFVLTFLTFPVFVIKTPTIINNYFTGSSGISSLPWRH